MAGNSYGLVLFCMLVFFLCAPVCTSVHETESITSPLNGKILELSDTPQDYSFFVAGHVYGAPESHSVFPSASFLANIDMLNHDQARFFILLGDNYRIAESSYIENFKVSICSNVEIPMFNAVGNHDVTDRGLYETHFGRTYFDFKHGSELFIILDSELDDGKIVGEQLDYLKNVLNCTIESEEVKNVFIFSHKLIWCVDDADMRIVYEHLNSRHGYANSDNFKSVVMPEIVRLSQTKKIFMVSGDIGVSWSLPLFYHKDEKYDITYIACGLGDTEKDAVIKVDIKSGGNVTFTPISLTGEKLEKMNHYGISYWMAHFGAHDQQSAKIPGMLTNIYFYLGIIFSVTIMGILRGGFILFNRLRK